MADMWVRKFGFFSPQGSHFPLTPSFLSQDTRAECIKTNRYENIILSIYLCNNRCNRLSEIGASLQGNRLEALNSFVMWADMA